jgi:phospholipase C
MGSRARSFRRLGVALALVPALALGAFGGGPEEPARADGTGPIRHVVVVYMENHSFDNVLGVLCVRDGRCDGALRGVLDDGRSIALRPAGDLVPELPHDSRSQATAIAGGAMTGFSRMRRCGPRFLYQCFSRYTPAQIPNLAALARAFALSDRTFELASIPSFGAHVELAAGRLDGFVGDNPHGTQLKPHPASFGWGCDSYLDTRWRAPATGEVLRVPACVPQPDGSGPYRPSPVPWVPTIMDRLRDAGLDWRIYAPSKRTKAYGWAICPTFADCLYTDEATHMVAGDRFQADAAAGDLPALSIVIPTGERSQHNGFSMLAGDNFIGAVVGSVMRGPAWGSTAVFVTYDDCGCFYDHVRPPRNRGIRVPMVIVSPYARAGFTDSSTASPSSILAYVEHTFGLAPLATSDARAYAFDDAFDYTQRPLDPVPMGHRPVPGWERRWIAAHPPDDDDPT